MEKYNQQTKSNISQKFLLPLVIIITFVSFGVWYFVTYILPSHNDAVAADINHVISQFDRNSPQSYRGVSKIADHGTDAIPYLEELLHDSAVEKRWAAVVGLSHIANQKSETSYQIIQILKTRTDDPNDSIELIVAGQLLSLGYKDAIPVLIPLLASEEVVLFTDPPEHIATRASRYLEQGTNEVIDFDYFVTSDKKQKQIDAWNQWWQENGSKLNWDQETGTFYIAND